MNMATAAWLLIVIAMGDSNIATVTTEAYLYGFECTAALEEVIEAQGGLLAAECKFVELPEGMFFDLFGERLS